MFANLRSHVRYFRLQPKFAIKTWQIEQVN